METQSAEIILKPKTPLQPEALRKAVQNADFTPGVIHLLANGQVADNTDTATRQFAKLVFKMPETDQTFLLISAFEQGTNETRTKDKLTQLFKAFKAGKSKFTISGRVREQKDLPIGLTVEDFTEIKDD